MHLQPIFQDYLYFGNQVSEELFNDGLCLPSGSNLTEIEKSRIKDVILDFFELKNK
jgi:dTDP-4-amino-4,6-dideoxygalactose transaminase